MPEPTHGWCEEARWCSSVNVIEGPIKPNKHRWIAFCSEYLCLESIECLPSPSPYNMGMLTPKIPNNEQARSSAPVVFLSAAHENRMATLHCLTSFRSPDGKMISLIPVCWLIFEANILRFPKSFHKLS